MRRIYSTTTWRNARTLVLRRDSYLCHWCGGPASEVDHLVSLSEGGAAYSPSNLVASCKRCNASRGFHVAKARRNRLFLGPRRRGTAQGRIPDTRRGVAIFGAIRADDD